MNRQNAQSILQMAKGAPIERIDREMPNIMANVLDLNTEAKATRELTIKIKFKPDACCRESVQVGFETRTKLAPSMPIGTSLTIGTDPRTGEIQGYENVPQVPGQMNFYGGEQQPPVMLNMGYRDADDISSELRAVPAESVPSETKPKTLKSEVITL